MASGEPIMKVFDRDTLVITYDFAFDPKGATFDATGAHALDVERETGTLAITTGTNTPSPRGTSTRKPV